jgi:hypothetical protein
VHNLLEKQIVIRAKQPENFSVEIWPVSRGIKELYIARQNADLSKFVWMGDFHAGWISDSSNEDAILVVATNGITIEEGMVFSSRPLVRVAPQLLPLRTYSKYERHGY